MSSSLCLRGDFLCTFCRSLTSPEIEYCDDSKKVKGEQKLSPEDQRVSTSTTSSEDQFIISTKQLILLFFSLQKCERLLLYMFCHELSVGFREPVPSSVSVSPQHTHIVSAKGGRLILIQ